MRAQQIPEEQAELLAKMRGNVGFRTVITATFARKRASDDEASLPIGEELAGLVTRHLEVAYPYFVTKDMSVLVQHAADGLDEEDLFNPSLAPTSAGFVRFEKPLDIIDARGWTMKGNWMSWGPAQAPDGQRATFITVWNDIRDPDSVVLELFKQFGADRIRQVSGNWSVLGGTMMLAGIPVGPSRIDVPEDYAAQLKEENAVPTPFTSVERLLHALWLMLDQTIVNTREEHVRPKHSHRARKMNLPTMVTIIDLRRLEGYKPADGESHTEWSHRWVTRGHWRWQPCGVGRTERKRIWINDFIKGPEGKPLVISQKVYALRR